MRMRDNYTYFVCMGYQACFPPVFSTGFADFNKNLLLPRKSSFHGYFVVFMALYNTTHGQEIFYECAPSSDEYNDAHIQPSS